MFALDPSCTPAEVSGTLELVAGDGDGEGGFKTLAAGAVPTTHSGSQGGQHLWTGLQIHNPNLDKPLHRISWHFQNCSLADDCSVETNWDPGSWGPDGETPEPERTMVADASILRETDAGWLEVKDVLVFLMFGVFEPYPDTQRRMWVRVEDSCGRVGSVVYVEE